jgi:hypothetical protein
MFLTFVKANFTFEINSNEVVIIERINGKKDRII